MTDGGYIRFVILGDARTGSNMVVQALNTNPEIRCFREIFHFMHDYVDYYVEGYDPNNRCDFELRAADPVRFLNERIFSEHPPDIRAVGFKCLYQHFWGFDGLIPHLTGDTELRVIHLKRRNWLRVLTSARIAEASGRWIEDWGLAAAPRPFVPRAISAAVHPLRTLSRLKRRKDERRALTTEKAGVVITHPECVVWFERSANDEARADAIAAGHPTIVVEYEDLARNRDREFERIQRFLGVEPVPLFVSLQRQNPEPLRDLIANYDELRASFAGTEYEAWFDG